MARTNPVPGKGDMATRLSKAEEEIRRLKLATFGPAIAAPALVWHSFTWPNLAVADGTGPRDECKWAIDGAGPGALLWVNGAIFVAATANSGPTNMATATLDLTPYVDGGDLFGSYIPVNVEDSTGVNRVYIPGNVRIRGYGPDLSDFDLDLFTNGPLVNGCNFWVNGAIRLQGTA